MNKLLAVTALAEVATGAALIVAPPLVGRWLLGAEPAGMAVPIAHLAGIALIALGIACWPGRTAFCGMLTYNTLATAFLACVGIRGDWVGPLLWPAVALHALVTLLLTCSWFAKRKADRAQKQSS